MTAEQEAMTRRSLARLKAVGYDTSVIGEIQFERYLSKGVNGLVDLPRPDIVLAETAFASDEMLAHVLEEELIHLYQKSAGLAESFSYESVSILERMVDDVRKFPHP